MTFHKLKLEKLRLEYWVERFDICQLVICHLLNISNRNNRHGPYYTVISSEWLILFIFDRFPSPITINISNNLLYAEFWISWYQKKYCSVVSIKNKVSVLVLILKKCQTIPSVERYSGEKRFLVSYYLVTKKQDFWLSQTCNYFFKKLFCPPLIICIKDTVHSLKQSDSKLNHGTKQRDLMNELHRAGTKGHQRPPSVTHDYTKWDSNPAVPGLFPA